MKLLKTVFSSFWIAGVELGQERDGESLEGRYKNVNRSCLVRSPPHDLLQMALGEVIHRMPTGLSTGYT